AAQLLNLHLVPGGTSGPVLDAGCGTGLSGEALHAQGFTRLVGIDVSEASLKLCKTKGIYEQLEICDLDCSAGPLQFEDNSFSGVVSVGVFSYVHNFERLFKELCRITAPGGVVVFTHRHPLWGEDVDGVRSAAAALEANTEAPRWVQLLVSEPQDYMPCNPDPAESSKKINYIVHRVL
ncbi:unnamed protein product, partial [Polarella glacialis]